MIQDIAPHRYDNAYRDLKPTASDYALCIVQNKTLLLCGEETQAAIPCFSQILPVFPEAFTRAVYLFSMCGFPRKSRPSVEENPVFQDDGAGLSVICCDHGHAVVEVEAEPPFLRPLCVSYDRKPDRAGSCLSFLRAD